MPTPLQTQFLAHTVASLARTDFTTLNQSLTVGEAIDVIRKSSGGSGIQYYYVVNDDGRLVGVLPLRRLITFPVDRPLREVMQARVIALPGSATVMDAAEFFVMHKFLAFPVVDERRNVIGVIDVSQFTHEMIDLGGEAPTDDVFEAIGFRIAQVKGASPVRAFRFRFPWLLATITSGIGCALLTSLFELTLAKAIVLTFFLALVLGLAESVSVQSMTVSIQTLRSVKPTMRWYLSAVRREMITAILLGLACGLVVGLVVWAWRGHLGAAAVVATGVCGAVLGACFFGLSVPAGLHALKLDPKIAAGPITLALTDILTLIVYFGMAAVVLG
ncbi:MAG TPA: magnesium transporter [Gemmataceae bacterium]|nr:magnesium transporter [Gemmataceae bacterium]